MMVAWMTVGVSLCAIFANTALLLFVAPEARIAWSLAIWAGGPFLAHCGAAIILRRNSAASYVVFAGTIVAGVCTVGVFNLNLQALIAARANGTEPPMNCAGPIVELGAPLIQWGLIGLFVGVASLSRRKTLWGLA